MFTIILYGFGMICMELTRIDAVFSTTTVVFVEGPEGEGVGHKTPGRIWALVRAPVGYSHLKAHLSVKPTPKIPINRETIKNNPRS